MLGGHCVKAWSSTQGAVALSSAEAEFYAMVDAVIRAKWMATVAKEMGMWEVQPSMILDTDSSAAKSFVARRGLGRMRHLEIRDLWLQQEVIKGNIEVRKIPGEDNPADLMTKFLRVEEIRERTRGMGIELRGGNKAGREKKRPGGTGASQEFADDEEGTHNGSDMDKAEGELKKLKRMICAIREEIKEYTEVIKRDGVKDKKKKKTETSEWDEFMEIGAVEVEEIKEFVEVIEGDGTKDEDEEQKMERKMEELIEGKMEQKTEEMKKVQGMMELTGEEKIEEKIEVGQKKKQKVE